MRLIVKHISTSFVGNNQGRHGNPLTSSNVIIIIKNRIAQEVQDILKLRRVTSFVHKRNAKLSRTTQIFLQNSFGSH